jgi:hypothetical protein
MTEMNAPRLKLMPTGTEPTNGSAPLRHHRYVTATTTAYPSPAFCHTLPRFSAPLSFTSHPHVAPLALLSLPTPITHPPPHPGNLSNGATTLTPTAPTPNPSLGDQGAAGTPPPQPPAIPSLTKTRTCNPTRSPLLPSKEGQPLMPLRQFATHFTPATPSLQKNSPLGSTATPT